MHCEILAVGDELVRGSNIDTNSAWLSRELAGLGLVVERFSVVGDGAAALQAAIVDACGRSELVICTGGLGPTLDDRNRAAAAAAAGVELEFDEGAWQQIVAMFRAFGRRSEAEVPASNRRQAYLPAGAELLENRWGTAPGFAMEIDGARFVALPGVPREMREMFALHLRPELAGSEESELRFHNLHVVGMREATLGERLEPFMAEGRQTTVGLTASGGQLTVRLFGRDPADLQTTAAELRPLLGPQLVYEGEHSLATEVGQRYLAAGVSLAVAESCTGGLLGAALTEVPGISAVFCGGFITYSNSAKVRDLGVAPELLDNQGAVSLEVAEAMAVGAAIRSGARVAVAITGIAGPDGGSEDKPVGTVWIGLCVEGRARAERLQLANLGRQLVRQWSVRQALVSLLRALDELG